MNTINRLIPFCVFATVALAPVAQAQHSGHSAMSGMHSQNSGMTMSSMKMGMSGMEALKGLSGREFNVAFLSQMIAHHQGAIDMAQQALRVARHAETRREAEGVITGQKSEIKQMTAWLQKWYGVRPSRKQADLMKADMKTMMSMRVENDRMFFEMMIPHHQGAIEMSRLALKQSDRAEVKRLARNIMAEQMAEISRYKSLLSHMS